MTRAVSAGRQAWDCIACTLNTRPAWVRARVAFEPRRKAAVRRRSGSAVRAARRHRRSMPRGRKPARSTIHDIDRAAAREHALRGAVAAAHGRDVSAFDAARAQVRDRSAGAIRFVISDSHPTQFPRGRQLAYRSSGQASVLRARSRHRKQPERLTASRQRRCRARHLVDACHRQGPPLELRRDPLRPYRETWPRCDSRPAAGSRTEGLD